MDADAIGNDNKLLKKGADAMGWKIIGNLRNQAHCVGSNRCAFGCPTGAKQSALVSYIPRALHFGARVYADVRVDRITRHGKRATGVMGRSVTRRPHGTTSRCARSSSSPRAARSTRRRCSCARASARRRASIGHNLSMHPNVKVVAIFDEAVTGWKGAHQAFQVREFEEQGPRVRGGQHAAVASSRCRSRTAAARSAS